MEDGQAHLRFEIPVWTWQTRKTITIAGADITKYFHGFVFGTYDEP